MPYETLVARFLLCVRGVSQSPCRCQSRDKRQGLWVRECVHLCFTWYISVITDLITVNTVMLASLIFSFSSVRDIRLCLPVDRGQGSLLEMVLVLGRGGR